MEWQRLSFIVRFFCLLMGVGGLFIAWGLLSHADLLKEHSAQTLFSLAMGGFGDLIFLVAGILGRFPSSLKSGAGPKP